MTNIMDPSLFKEYLLEKGLSDSTSSHYVITLRQFLMSDPDVNDVNSYLNFLVKTSVKKRCVANVNCLFHYVRFKINDNKLKNNIIERIKNMKIEQQDPDIKKDIKPLTDKELTNVIDNFKMPKHKIMSYIMISTGLRIGDVLRIKPENVFIEDDDRKQILKIITMTKGEKKRTTFIWQPAVIELITEFMITNNFNSGYLFLQYRTTIKERTIHRTEYELIQYNYQLYHKDLKEAMINTNLDRFRHAPHDFRRQFASKVWKKFKDIVVLKDMMGHQRIETSLKYLRQSGINIKDSLREIQMGS